MAVVIETTLGDITVDLFIEQRPTTCLNFLKLCKMKYYNFNLFHTIRRGFIAQTGDPTGEGSGGESIFGLLEGPQKRFFSGEKMPKIRHTDAGLLSMVCTGETMVGSQFFFTLGTDLDSLDGVHCVIGEVTEGQDILRKLNDIICDETHRPYQDVRITHTVVLADPFNDPAGLREPSRSPSPSAERLKGGRIAPDEDIDETQGKSAMELQELIEEKEAKARATILEIVGDLPDADIAPPENVLFVCKLNPVTSDEDLEIIFSRFGKIVTCEVIRDKKTGDSLQYAFIEFADKKSCEDAYFKMDNVLIDDRRIHVDFSQSVSKIKWLGKGRGVKHIGDDYSADNNRYRETRERIQKSPNREKNRSTTQMPRKSRDYQRETQKYKERENRHHQTEKDYHSRKESHKDVRKRSRSRSPIRERKDRIDRDKNSNRPFDNKPSKHSDRENNDKSSKKYNESKNGTEKNDSSRSKFANTSRHNNNTDLIQNINKEKSEKDRHQKHTGHNQKKINGLNENEKEKPRNKKKHGTDKDSKTDKRNSSTGRKDKKVEDDTLTKTPSPDVIKTKKKAKPTKHSMKSKVIEKKRKISTSSSSESSSSSSSETSSSSESDHKKKKSRRKKRHSSSESSTSDSSSSSSSSSSTDSSSDSTTSSSDSDNKKRKAKKTGHKKTVKKVKRK